MLDRAPDLDFKHYTADELQLPHDIVLALGDVRLASLEVCADTSRNIFNPAHTDPRVGDALRASFWTDLDDLGEG